MSLVGLNVFLCILLKVEKLLLLILISLGISFHALTPLYLIDLYDLFVRSLGM